MRSAGIRLRKVPVVAAALAIPVFAGLAVVMPPADAAQAGGGSMSDRQKFVGTYRLITTETKDASGKWSPRPNYRSIGYISYGDAGHMGVYIVPRNRALFAGAQPTPEEAQTALQGFTAYFGPFTVHEAEGEQYVIHNRVGQIRPGGPSQVKRFYDFEGDRLILTPAPASGGKDAATNRLIWERLPDAPLTPEERKFVGFYRLVYQDRYRERDGKEIFHGDRTEARAGTSYIIYTPTGHMMAHLMPREGRTPYAGDQPTPEEALKAFQTYGGYFGRFTTYENHQPPFVMHHQQGMARPGSEVDATKRFYQFTGNILRLAPPPAVNEAGETEGAHLYWERISAASTRP